MQARVLRSRALRALVAFTLTAFLAPAAAAAVEEFSEARFRALQAKKALILVDVAAEWCSTCGRQQAVVERYQSRRPEVGLQVLRVDFDRQKRWVAHFGAPAQSTLILFRGEERVWFSVGQTSESAIFEAIDRAAAAL